MLATRKGIGKEGGGGGNREKPKWVCRPDSHLPTSRDQIVGRKKRKEKKKKKKNSRREMEAPETSAVDVVNQQT